MHTTEEVRRTPLYDKHVELGARLAPFAGYEMPIQYEGIIEEHLAVRAAAGMFDVSHMGEVLVRGPHAFEFVQHLVTNDADRLYDGRAMYTVMCREDGGIVDDLIVYRLAADEYLFVINAANRKKDLDWMIQNNPAKADLLDISDEVALIAVQGPEAIGIVESVIDQSLEGVKFYHFTTVPSEKLAGSNRAIISRTGYTGEPGVEIYCDASRATNVWDALLESGRSRGLRPAGLGARDTLRIEAGYCLYGNDITDDTNPLEAGLEWLTKLDKDDFIGKRALQQIRAEGLSRKLVGFVLQERGIPRAGYPILSPDGDEIGVVTSGTQSPVLRGGIGLGYVQNEPSYTEPGVEIVISVRGRKLTAIVKKPPLHEK